MSDVSAEAHGLVQPAAHSTLPCRYEGLLGLLDLILMRPGQS